MFPVIEYENIKKLNPYWSDFTCFAETVKDKPQLHPRTIRKYFNKLVDKDDYAQEDKNEIMKFLIDRSNSIL